MAEGASVRAFVYYNSFGTWGWLDTLPKGTLDQQDVFTGDIRDFNCVYEAAKDIDVIFHLAALIGIPYSYQAPDSYIATNINGTTNVLQAARMRNVEKVICTSTSEIYGTAQSVPIDENHPVNPQSPYAATKLAGELLCHTAHHLHGLSIACLRFFTVYGPRQRPDMAIHKFTRLIDQEEEVPVFGDGSSSRDYTYYEDCVDGVVAALEADLGFEIINLGDHRQVPLSLLLELIEQSIGKRAHRVYLPMQPGDVRTTYADITKAGSLLGYEPRFPIEQGIEIFVDWYRKHVDILVG